MSLAPQLTLKRQCCHATKTSPVALIAALGRGEARSPPASLWREIVATGNGPRYVSPPLVDTKDSRAVAEPLSIGITTVPFGCASGWPPRTALCAGTPERDHRSPASSERASSSWLLWAWSSHST